MNCSQAQNILNTVSQQGTVVLKKSGVQEHLNECEICRHYLSDQLLQRQLTSIKVPPLRDEFVDVAIRTAITTYAERSAQRRNHWAMAAVLLVGVLLGTLATGWLRGPAPQPAIDPSLGLVLNQVSPVNVLIDSEQNLEEVTLSITLADNLEVDGYPLMRELSWNTRLMAGKNLLTLPLWLHSREDSFVEVTYASGDHVHRKRILIRAVDAPPDSAFGTGKQLKDQRL